MYTALKHEIEGTEINRWFKQSREAVGITTGPAPIDVDPTLLRNRQQYSLENSESTGANAKAQREVFFPIELLDKAIGFKCEDGKATRKEDEKRIQGAVGEEAQDIDTRLRGVVAEKALHRVFKEKANSDADEKATVRVQNFVKAVQCGVQQMTINLPTDIDTDGNLAMLLSGSNVKHKKLVLATSRSSLPDGTWLISTLTKLDIRAPISELPPSISELKHLKHLSLRECKVLKALPESLAELKQLNLLNIRACPALETLPDVVVEMCHRRTYINIFACEPRLQQHMKTMIHQTNSVGSQNLNSGKAALCSLGIGNVIGWLKHNDFDIRKIAVDSLSQLQVWTHVTTEFLSSAKQLEEAQSKLLDCLKHTEWHVRAAALDLIRKLPQDFLNTKPPDQWCTQVQTKLEAALDDPDWHVRRAAVKRFDKLPVDELKKQAEYIRPHLEDKQWSVRAAAIRVFGKLPTPTDVAPELRSLLDDPNEDVREIAVEVVGKHTLGNMPYQRPKPTGWFKALGPLKQRIIEAAESSKWNRLKGCVEFAEKYAYNQQQKFDEREVTRRQELSDKCDKQKQVVTELSQELDQVRASSKEQNLTTDAAWEKRKRIAHLQKRLDDATSEATELEGSVQKQHVLNDPENLVKRKEIKQSREIQGLMRQIWEVRNHWQSLNRTLTEI